MKKTGILLLTILLAFAAHTLLSTGFFRKITSSNNRAIVAKIPLRGAEDIVISPDETFALISATDRETYPSQKMVQGGMYYLSLTDSAFIPKRLTKNLDFDFVPQ